MVGASWKMLTEKSAYCHMVLPRAQVRKDFLYVGGPHTRLRVNLPLGFPTDFSQGPLG